MLDSLGAGFEFGEPCRHRLTQARQVGDRDLVLASSRTQREQPLLGFFKLARVEFELARRRLERCQRLGGFSGGALGGCERVVKQALGTFASAIQLPGRSGESGLRTRIAVQLAHRLAQGFGEPFSALQ